ncbi:MAG: uncharacterized protein QOJ69_2174, partial [Actinomycetota bacterium]|nr:uncharacterized protein [Actinomycetota bacterium]
RRFFERVFEEQRSCATTVAFTNATQTNATHLDDDMLDFLLANDVGIGLSLDGPMPLNDGSRRSRRRLPMLADGAGGGGCASNQGGCGTNQGFSAHETTVGAARRLQDRGRGAAAIVTVNRHNVGRPEAVYREFNDRRIHMKVNPLTRSGLADTPLGSDLGITDVEYGEFLVRLFDAWFDDPDAVITIDPFGQHIARIVGDEVAHNCFYTLSCHRFFLGVSPDGDLFPCGMFQGEPSFRYGNIGDMEPEDVARTMLFGDIDAREQKVLEDCSRCAFFDLCYSGCMFHSL